MNLDEIMDEIADRIRTIDTLAGRTFAYPPKKVEPPAAIVSYPDSIDFDATYGRGVDTINDLTVTVVVGKPTERTSRDRIAGYVAGSGPDSIKAALEVANPVAWDDGRVSGIEFALAEIAGVEYLAAIFKITLAGRGTVS